MPIGSYVSALIGFWPNAALTKNVPSSSTTPAITLSTVHSVKGAEWKNVTVLMPQGIFPLERKRKPDEPPPDPVEEAARIKSERNLAYVALTRAAKNLEILCPGEKGMSPFVHEAGLHAGQNVEKPGTDPTAAPVKLASESDLDESHIDETLAMYSDDVSPMPVSFTYNRGTV